MKNNNNNETLFLPNAKGNNGQRLALIGACAIALYLLFAVVGFRLYAANPVNAPVCNVASLTEISFAHTVEAILQGELSVEGLRKAVELRKLSPKLADSVLKSIDLIKKDIIADLSSYFTFDDSIKNALQSVTIYDQMAEIIKDNPAVFNLSALMPGDRMGDSILHKAVVEGKIDLVRVLLRAGAPVDVENNFGDTPLLDAATYNHPLVVKELLAYGADVNKENSTTWTDPLIAALHSNNDEVANILLDTEKINLMVIDRKGNRPIEIAKTVNASPQIMTRLQEEYRKLYRACYVPAREND